MMKTCNNTMFTSPIAFFICLMLISAYSLPMKKSQPKLIRLNSIKQTSSREGKLSFVMKEEHGRENQRALLEIFQATSRRRASVSLSYSMPYYPTEPSLEEPDYSMSFSFPSTPELGEDISLPSSMSYDYSYDYNAGGLGGESGDNEGGSGTSAGTSEVNVDTANTKAVANTKEETTVDGSKAKGEAPASENQEQSTDGNEGMSASTKAMMITFLGIATAMAILGLLLNEKAKRRLQSGGSAASESFISYDSYSGPVV